MLTSRIVLALGLCLGASNASASTFDGDYDLEHQSVQGSVDICLDYGGYEGCAPLQLELILEDGQVGMESLTRLMDDILDDLEDARGKALPPRVEAGLFTALERAYGAVESQLGVALSALPLSMSVTQAPMDDARLMAELTNGRGDVWVVPGEVSPTTGAFDLVGSMSGQFEALSTSKGKGKMGMDVSLGAEEAGLTVTLDGRGTVEFGLF